MPRTKQRFQRTPTQHREKALELRQQKADRTPEQQQQAAFLADRLDEVASMVERLQTN
jgi:hypothetical protein